MASINLLPWREERRRRRQKEYIVLLVAAVFLMIGVVAGVHFEFQRRIEHQQVRNNFLKEQIAVLDRKIEQIRTIEEEKANLLARMEIIEQLQSSRPEIVRLMDELVTTLPDGVYYTKVKQVGRNLEVEGVAQSNARVSSLMRNIDKSPWFENPELVEIRKQAAASQQEASRFSTFSLRFSQIKQKGEGEETS